MEYVIMYKIKNGNIVGGYTTKKFEKNISNINGYIWYRDQNAFLYCINEKLKILPKESDK